MRLRSGILALFLACTACGGGAPPSPPSAGPAEGGGPPITSPTGGVNESRHLPAEYLVLVSFDGFRADYLDMYDTPAFDRVIEYGARAEGLIPPFPSLTFPSHFTIATGLWPENHGIVGNRFLDPVRGDEYNYREPSDVGDGSWYSGEPIWTTAETQGMVAASYFWVGSEAEIGGARPSYWYPYDAGVPGTRKVDRVLEWLALPEARRPHVITLYFSDVDGAGHASGPLSADVQRAVARVDGYLDRLIRGISSLPHGERVNLVLVSDHGMADHPPREAEFVDLSEFPEARFVGGNATASIFVDGNAALRREVYRAVRAQLPDDVRVFPRSEAPAAFHISASPRAGDIIIAPPVGVSVWPEGYEPRDGAGHGWFADEPSMHGIFIASGPRIREGARLRPFDSVDIYPFLVELLGLESAPVDGQLRTLGSLIRDQQ